MTFSACSLELSRFAPIFTTKTDLKTASGAAGLMENKDG
jgi:hypothetical protein